MKEEVGFIFLLLTQAAMASPVPQGKGSWTEESGDSSHNISTHLRNGIIAAIGIMAIFVIVSVTNCETTNPEVVCSSKPVEAAVSEDVILQCRLETLLDVTNMTVEWSHEGHNHTVHLYQDRKDNPAEQREHFEGRTSLFHEGLTKGNLSLKLSSLRLSDTGRYRCSFSTEKPQNNCYVNLTVGHKLQNLHYGLFAVFGIIIIIGIVTVCRPNCETITLSELISFYHVAFNLPSVPLSGQWSGPGLDPEYIHVHQDGRLVYEHQNPSYYYHTRLFVDQLINGNVSMKIFRVKISDAGKYRCFLPSIQKEASTLLNVEPVEKRNDGSQTNNENTDTNTKPKNNLGRGIGAVSIIIFFLIALWKKRGRTITSAGRHRRGRNR